MLYLQISVAVLLLLSAYLIIKMCIIKKSLREIKDSLSEKLEGDTNTLISVTSRDRDVMKLASSLNRELSVLSRQRQRYLLGDSELKTAVTNISHDLRTPLTAIYGYLDLLEDEDVSENAREYLMIIRKRAERMKGLTDELFGFSLILSSESSVRTEDTDITSVLEESIAQSYALMKENGIEPKISVPEQKVILPSDRRILLRIFENILSNAVKYGKNEIEITLYESGKIEFINPAPKLSTVQTQRLFDRFYTVDEGRSSTGIGLSIVKSLTQKIGGKISADYKDKCLCITLEL